MHWERTIGELILVQQERDRLDAQGVYQRSLPGVGAAPARVAAMEERIGVKIPRDYAEFLGFADGWSGFFHHLRLFGTTDLEGSRYMERAKALISELDPQVLAELNPVFPQFIPIAVSFESIDLFVMCLDRTRLPHGTILWIQGREIERYNSFSDYFAAMLSYNRDAVRFFRRRSRSWFSRLFSRE